MTELNENARTANGETTNKKIERRKRKGRKNRRKNEWKKEKVKKQEKHIVDMPQPCGGDRKVRSFGARRTWHAQKKR